MNEQQFISCSDECGQCLPAEAVEQAGWTFLQIRGRWRCPACRRALERINRHEASQDGSFGGREDVRVLSGGAACGPSPYASRPPKGENTAEKESP